MPAVYRSEDVTTVVQVNNSTICLKQNSVKCCMVITTRSTYVCSAVYSYRKSSVCPSVTLMNCDHCYTAIF